MSFIMRQPLSVATVIKSLPRSSQPTFRTFHSTSTSNNLLLKSRHAFRTQQQPLNRLTSPSSSKRFYNNPSIPTQTGGLGSRLLYGGAIVAGGALAANLVFNRETREDGGMPLFERSYLNETFMHTGLGVGMIGIAARALHTSGWSVRLMSMNPWLVVGGGLALSIGSMITTRSIDPDKWVFHVSMIIPLSMLLEGLRADICDTAIATSRNTPPGPRSTSPKR